MTTAVRTQRWTPTTESLGARLALIRQHMGWTNLKEAAIACGLPVQSWRNWEADASLPRDVLGVARRISEVTGVDYYWLLDGGAGMTASHDSGDAVHTGPRKTRTSHSVRLEGFEPPTF